MEQEPSPHSTPPESPELEGSAETQASTIDTLLEVLGFVETEELSRLREELIEAMRAGSDIKELITRYHLLAEEIIGQQEGDDFAKAQIGLIVQMGLIRRDGGQSDDFAEDLRDALTYATNMGLTDIVSVLEEALTSSPD